MISLNQLFSDTEKSGFLKYLLMKEKLEQGLGEMLRQNVARTIEQKGKPGEMSL